MPGCAAIGCNNRSEKGYTMKCFPRDPALRSIWKQRVGRADWEPSNNSFLCHVHFDPNQWIVTQSGRIKLKKGAVPSIFTVTSTRKSPKKRQKMGVQKITEEDLEEYEVEYLENDCPFVIQKIVPNISSIQSQNTTMAAAGGQLMQHMKILSGDALKNLQNENIIIVSDENNREIGKIINDSSGFILVESERGKENVRIVSKPEKTTPVDVKIEIKEEMPENGGLSIHDYNEIERKLQEICHSEEDEEEYNDDDNDNDRYQEEKEEENPPKEVNSHSFGAESTFSLDYSENSSEGVNSNVAVVTTGTKRKRANTIESQNHEDSSQPSQIFKKTNGLQDVNDIIQDLETDTPEDSNNESLKTIEENDDLNTKLNVQGEVIEKLTNQLIMYKDMEFEIQNLTEELKSKTIEIERLRKLSVKKAPVERKNSRTDSFNIEEASETELRNRVEFLENKTKQLTRNISFETQNRRKLECQVKNRDNQIKELNWKLEKASKFLDRAEKNANNYKKKMVSMQAVVRRKKLHNEKSSTLDELSVCQSNCDFTESALKIALEIEKVCGIEGYQKLLSYDFPLPPLKLLTKEFPGEVDYCEPDEEEVVLEDPLSVNNMENIEYLDAEFIEPPDITMTGTVQDIFNEDCDSDEDLDLDELRKHIIFDSSFDS